MLVVKLSELCESPGLVLVEAFQPGDPNQRLGGMLPIAAGSMGLDEAA